MNLFLKGSEYMKKLYFLLSIIVLIFIGYLIIFITPRNYKIKYQKNNINITEEYSKKNNGYYYLINYKNIKYPIYKESNYKYKRIHITKINVVNDKDITCLNVYFNPEKRTVCSNDNQIIDYRLLNEEFLDKYYKYQQKDQKIIDTYNNIKIYNYDNNDLYIWNYKELLFVNEKNKTEEIKLFKKDNYSNKLMYQDDNYLIIPNYDSKYYFKKVFIYDMKNQIMNDINFDYEISYNSYYMGSYKNKVYLIDKKNNRQYSIDLKKLKVKLTGSKTKKAFYYNGKDTINKNIKNYTSKEVKFPISNNYKYILKENYLFLNIKNINIKVSNQKIDNILNQSKDTIYYVSKGAIYSYNILEGEQKLLKNEEWKFNNKNILFVYNNQK